MDETELKNEENIKLIKNDVLIIGPYSNDYGTPHDYDILKRAYESNDKNANVIFSLYDTKGILVVDSQKITGWKLKTVIIHMTKTISKDMLEILINIAYWKVPGLLIAQNEVEISEPLKLMLNSLSSVGFERNISEVMKDVLRLSKSYKFNVAVDPVMVEEEAIAKKIFTKKKG